MDLEINDSLIKQVASNANLILSDDELNLFREDFKEILKNFEKLEEAEVPEKASFHPVNIKNKFNEDVVEDSITQKEALSNVDESEDGFIRGPKVVN